MTLEQHEMEYLYSDGTEYHFMNTENYEQTSLTAEDLGGAAELSPAERQDHGGVLREQGARRRAAGDDGLRRHRIRPRHQGVRPRQNQLKPATLETGLVVQVPPFINPGDLVRVDTSSGGTSRAPRATEPRDGSTPSRRT